MDSRESLVALRDRVAGLKEADREVDSLVTFALLHNEWRDVGSGAGHAVMLRDGTPTHMGRVPYFTASVDAVLSLIQQVLPDTGCGFLPGWTAGHPFAGAITPRGERTINLMTATIVGGPTPALALLLALLTALTSGGQTHG